MSSSNCKIGFLFCFVTFYLVLLSIYSAQLKNEYNQRKNDVHPKFRPYDRLQYTDITVSMDSSVDKRIMHSNDTKNTSLKLKVDFKATKNETLKQVPKLKNPQISSKNRNTTPLRILLQTNYRSGSSFIGEFLKNNPGSYYSFEPLYLLADERITLQQRVSFLENLLFHCNLLKTANLIEKYNYPADIKSWTLRSFGAENLPASQARCLRARDVSMKTIRLPLLRDSVEPITSSGGVVLYLVRDPRGVISSRTKIHGKQKAFMYTEEAKSICQQHLFNIKYIRNQTIHGQLKHINKVKILRYEDFAVNPTEMGEKLYSFLGRDLPNRVKVFIASNTKTTGTWTYGVKRVSKQTVFNWRSYLKTDMVSKIQDVCDEAMNELGYVLLKSENLRNMEISAIRPPAKDLPVLL